MSASHTNWLRSINLLPDKLVPATPSILNSFEVEWDNENISANGRIKNKILTGKTATADFDLQTKTDGVLSFAINIDSEDEQGKLSL